MTECFGKRLDERDTGDVANGAMQLAVSSPRIRLLVEYEVVIELVLSINEIPRPT